MQSLTTNAAIQHLHERSKASSWHVKELWVHSTLNQGDEVSLGSERVCLFTQNNAIRVVDRNLLMRVDVKKLTGLETWKKIRRHFIAPLRGQRSLKRYASWIEKQDSSEVVSLQQLVQQRIGACSQISVLNQLRLQDQAPETSIYASGKMSMKVFFGKRRFDLMRATEYHAWNIVLENNSFKIADWTNWFTPFTPDKVYLTDDGSLEFQDFWKRWPLSMELKYVIPENIE